MNIYLVGGAIRDELLGIPVHERDWVVVGSTPQELIKKGFQPVGKEFPVFLHPETHEEYALARTERKVGKGYKGFTFYAAADVSLEEDLKRRDLTINAMARSKKGELIDPFQGGQDLQNKILRHVSNAFVEDPVRILRIARFAAKLPDFQVATETNELMRQMVANGEVDALVSERVWQEFERALNEKKPQRFFEVLAECGALPLLFPEIHLHGSGMQALARATEVTAQGKIRFAALMHDVPEKQIQELGRRLKVPRDYLDLALSVSHWYPTYQNLLNCDAEQILSLLKSVDVFRRPQRFADFLTACRISSESTTQSDLLNKLATALNEIDLQPLIAKYKNRELADQIRTQQLSTITKLIGLTPTKM